MTAERTDERLETIRHHEMTELDELCYFPERHSGNEEFVLRVIEEQLASGLKGIVRRVDDDMRVEEDLHRRAFRLGLRFSRS